VTDRVVLFPPRVPTPPVARPWRWFLRLVPDLALITELRRRGAACASAPLPGGQTHHSLVYTTGRRMRRG
jgi:hypothetical protein